MKWCNSCIYVSVICDVIDQDITIYTAKLKFSMRICDV